MILAFGCGKSFKEGESEKYNTAFVAGASETNGDWPWMVSIGNFSGGSWNHHCGGTVISKTLILTAAHCITDLERYIFLE